MTAAPKLTIAICTRNRRERLEQCLRSVEAEIADHDIEVLVVDNASDDGTANLLHSWGDGGRRRVAVESTVGLSSARNRALRDARARFVAFVDDDATVRPGYAPAILAQFAHDGVVAVGGRIDLVFEGGAQPGWASPTVERFWSRFDHGDEPRPIEAPRSPYGCNFAVDRRRALKAGGFDPRLGYVARDLLSGEEAELVHRLRLANGRVGYAPDARVDHVVDSDRARVSWIARRAWNQGRAEIRRSVLGDSRGPLGIRANAARVRATARRLRPRRSAAANAEQLVALAVRLGALHETLRQRAGASDWRTNPDRRRLGRNRRNDRPTAAALADLEHRIARLERSHRQVHGPMIADLTLRLESLRSAEDDGPCA